MLSWFKKKPEPSPAVQFARAIGYGLDWWLLLLADDGRLCSQNERVLEAALGLHGEGRSVRNATAYMANLLVGELILSHASHVREEALAYMRDPEVADALLQMSSTEVVMMLDLVNGPNVGVLAMGAGVREQLRKDVLEQTEVPSLSSEAKLLFAGVRHLWARVLVAMQEEKDDEDLRWMAGRLMSESVYALEGADADARRARHAANVLEDAVGKAAPDADLEA